MKQHSNRMKNGTIFGIVFGLLVSNLSVLRAETLNWTQLPVVVQRAINDERGPVGIVSIERVDRFGSPVYEVQLQEPGPNNKFAVTETGTIVKTDDLSNGLGLGASKEITFGSLPIAVQNTIRSRVGDAPIQSIE